MQSLDLKVVTVAFFVANVAGKFVWWVMSKGYHLVFPSGLL